MFTTPYQLTPSKLLPSMATGHQYNVGHDILTIVDYQNATKIHYTLEGKQGMKTTSAHTIRTWIAKAQGYEDYAVIQTQGMK